MRLWRYRISRAGKSLMGTFCHWALKVNVVRVLCRDHASVRDLRAGFLQKRRLFGGSRRNRLRCRGAGGGRGRSDATGTHADDGSGQGDDR